MRRPTRVAMVPLILLTLSPIAQGQAPPTQLSKDEIIVGLTQFRSQLERMRAEYTVVTVDRKGKLLEQRSFSFARDGQKRFSDVHFMPPADHRHRTAGTYDGKLSRQLFSGGHGTIRAGKDRYLDGYDLLCHRFHVPARAVEYALEREPDQTYYLPSGVGNDRYFVRPEQEQVGGRWAHVLWVKNPEVSFNAYWVDVEQDFALLKAELRRGTSVADRLVYDQFQPAGERVMPRRITIENFRDGGRNPEWIRTVTIHDIAVGPVPPETFELIFPPGTLVADTVLKRGYQIPGDPTKQLEELSDQARQEIIAFQRGMHRPPWYAAAWLRWTGGLLLAALLAGLAWWLFVMRR